MPTHRIETRQARGRPGTFVVSREQEALASYLEDAAHFPGGFATAIVFPRTEADVAEVIQSYPHLLPIGAQSSVTGGATPRGETLISLSKMDAVVSSGEDWIRVQPGLSVASLKDEVLRLGRYYAPAPTYDGALVGGTIATNASGAATFKYGSTRRWVKGLTVVLASGEALDIERGKVVAHPDGYFDIAGSSGVTRVRVPTYAMPDVPKRSAGYFAAPGMDLIDLFIGSEGTLGVVVEATLVLRTTIPATCMALIPLSSEEAALALVGRLRSASVETWKSGDPSGLDVSAIEFLDERCLAMLHEDGADRRSDITIPSGTAIVLLVQVELAPGTTAETAFEQIGQALEPGAADSTLARLSRMLDEAGALETTELAMPGDRHRAQQFFDFREAAPEAVKSRVAQLKSRTGADIEKTAADMIVPFAHFGRMMARYREGYSRRGLDYAIWGHISDGNVHPNVIPRSIDDVRAGKEAIAEFGAEVTRLGGCPLAEHGVGRSAVKQALLRQLYGDAGIAQMRAVKAALDPGWKLAPGVLFPASE